MDIAFILNKDEEERDASQSVGDIRMNDRPEQSSAMRSRELAGNDNEYDDNEDDVMVDWETDRIDTCSPDRMTFDDEGSIEGFEDGIDPVVVEKMRKADPCYRARNSMADLMRRHLELVMTAKDSTDERATNVHSVRDSTKVRTDNIELLIGLYLDGKDAILAAMMYAAYMLERSQFAPAVRFLEVTLHKHCEPNSGTRFLMEMLKQLLHMKQEKENENSPTAGARLNGHQTPTKLRVLHDGKDLLLGVDEILPHFWSHGNAKHLRCESCRHPINLSEDLLIRTVSVPRKGCAIRTAHRSITIRDRHLDCSKDNSNFSIIPISHVWHNSIRDANRRNERIEEAAGELIKRIELLSEIKTTDYRPSVEFWHDYFSVAQWDQKIKERALLGLPSIYSRSREIVKQLHNVPPKVITEIFVSMISSRQAGIEAKAGGAKTGRLGEIEAEQTLEETLESLERLLILFDSAWMTRMWVTLDYAQCKRASLLQMDGSLLKLLDGTEPENAVRKPNRDPDPDTLAKLLAAVKLQYHHLTEHCLPLLRTSISRIAACWPGGEKGKLPAFRLSRRNL